MFSVGKPVYGKDFFDRKEMLLKVRNFIQLKQDFMIKAPRRYGKTSLIKEALIDQDYIYIDIRKIPNISLLPLYIIDKAYELDGLYNFRDKIKRNVVDFLSDIKNSINLKVKIDYSIIEASASYLSNSKETNICEDLVFALETLEKISKSLNKNTIIVFDEFQDIKKFNCGDNDILEVLRGVLQHFSFVNTIFLGSIETIMTDIFENKKSPFFNYCRKLKLLEFDLDELFPEILNAFTMNDIFFKNDEDLKALLKKSNGHPANTMIVLQNVYYISTKKPNIKLDNEDLETAFIDGYYEMLDLIEQYIIEIKNKKHYHDVLYKIANNQKQTLSNQALHQVKKGLLDMGYLQKIEKGNYKIIDNFLEFYLKTSIGL